jgi:hypothetical protein
MTQHSSIHKWLTLGIILLLVGVTFVPNISRSIVKASTNNNVVENEKANSLQLPSGATSNYQIKGTIRNLIILFVKHPILLKMIQTLNFFRGALVYFLQDYSAEWFHHTILEIKHPLAFLLYVVLAIRYIVGIYFWVDISDILGWEWTSSDVSGGWY